MRACVAAQSTGRSVACSAHVRGHRLLTGNGIPNRCPAQIFHYVLRRRRRGGLPVLLGPAGGGHAAVRPGADAGRLHGRDGRAALLAAGHCGARLHAAGAAPGNPKRAWRCYSAISEASLLGWKRSLPAPGGFGARLQTRIGHPVLQGMLRMHGGGCAGRVTAAAGTAQQPGMSRGCACCKRKVCCAPSPQVDMANASLRPGRDSGWLARLTQRILSQVEASTADITAHSSTWQHDLDQVRVGVACSGGLQQRHPKRVVSKLMTLPRAGSMSPWSDPR